MPLHVIAGSCPHGDSTRVLHVSLHLTLLCDSPCGCRVLLLPQPRCHSRAYHPCLQATFDSPCVSLYGCRVVLLPRPRCHSRAYHPCPPAPRLRSQVPHPAQASSHPAPLSQAGAAAPMCLHMCPSTCPSKCSHVTPHMSHHVPHHVFYHMSLFPIWLHVCLPVCVPPL